MNVLKILELLKWLLNGEVAYDTACTLLAVSNNEFDVMIDIIASANYPIRIINKQRFNKSCKFIKLAYKPDVSIHDALRFNKLRNKDISTLVRKDNIQELQQYLTAAKEPIYIYGYRKLLDVGVSTMQLLIRQEMIRQGLIEGGDAL